MSKKIKPVVALAVDSGSAQAAMIAEADVVLFGKTQPTEIGELQAPVDALKFPDKSAPPKILRITCTHEGFRRGGRAWSTTPTEVHVNEFTAVQLQQLYAEARLTVEAIG